MTPSLRKLVLAIAAILAFAVGNFAMVSGMAHGGEISGSDFPSSACDAAHGFANAGHAGDHGCKVAPEGMCGEGPTCCSNACQALILVSDFAYSRPSVELVEPLPLVQSFTSTTTFLDRPPRA